MNLARALLCSCVCLLVAAPGHADLPREEAQRFLERYTQTYVALAYESTLAEWESNTRIVEGDDTNAKRTRAANEALAAFTGSVENIAACRRLLEQREALEPLQVLQLERVLYRAADKPQSAPELVRARIAADTAQNERLYGFTYRIGEREVTTNDIDEILRTSSDAGERLAAWSASKEIGPTLRPGLLELRRLRNATVRELGYPDYFTYQVSEYAQELPGERWNARWWELAARYQGIAPPAERDERWCDATTKTHINDDAAQYYDYALSFVLLFQLHDHIAREILEQDPHDTNYFGSRDVGAFLTSIMAPGASADWRTLLREKTGLDLSARAMLAYFAPLMAWLQKENRGRKHTLPG